MNEYGANDSYPSEAYQRARKARLRTFSPWIALTVSLIVFGFSLGYAETLMGWGLFFWLAGFSGIPFLFMFWSNWKNAAVQKAHAGHIAERRTQEALKQLPEGYVTLANITPPGWPDDIDILVLGPKKIVIVSVKSDPGILVEREGRWESHRLDGIHDLSNIPKSTKIQANRFKHVLIQLAQKGLIQEGIPSLHAVTVIDPMHRSIPKEGPDGLTRIKELPRILETLPDNVSPLQRESIRQIVKNW